jgi:two-component system copper resistance phosphate regulon response regulator CusR
MYILIVEDEEKTAVSLQKGLAEIGIRSDLANNGLDGLALALRKDYDLIILDVMLPGINGWEFLRCCRGKRTLTRGNQI